MDQKAHLRYQVELMRGGGVNFERYRPLEITSLQNPKVKQLIALREHSSREETGLFLVEGYREILRATEAQKNIQTLFICPSLFLGSNEYALIEQVMSQCSQLVICSEPVFRKMSYRDRPDGLIAIAPQEHLSLNQLKIKQKAPFLVIAEAIEKPGNLGTILRSSDASGVDGLIVCDRCTDIYNPNVVRSSVGTLFTVPVAEVSSQEAIQWLKQQKIAIMAATPSAKASYTDVDLTGPVAIAVGTEQLGLSDLWMDQADIQVRIPMLGKADSLNVAMATTLLLYEVVRQRQLAKSRP